MSAPALFNLDQFPAVVLKEVFDRMSPCDLIQLSAVSENRLRLIQWLNLKADVNITFTPTHVSIGIKNIKESSVILVGQIEGSGEKFDCLFDQEYFSGCMRTDTGVIFPYGLNTLIRRILNLFPRAVTSINIALGSSTNDLDYEPIFETLQMIRSNGWSPESINYVLENEQYSVQTIEPLRKISEIVGRYVQLPKTLIIENEHNFPFQNFLRLGLEAVHVKNSQLTDEDFNQLLCIWNASTNRRLHTFVVGTSEKSMDLLGDLILMGMSRVGESGTALNMDTWMPEVFHRFKRTSDGASGAVIRTDKEFMFTLI